MNRHSLGFVLLIGLTPAVLSSECRAQAAPDDATTVTARARFKEGVALYDQGRYEEARSAFLQAYALRRHPVVLLNLAWCSLKSGRALEASRYFRQLLLEGKDVTDKQRADANDGLNQARSSLGSIEIVAPPGTLVTLDGEGVGSVPLREVQIVEPGGHVVRVKTLAGATESQTITVTPGEKVTARFLGTRPPSPVPPSSVTEAPPPVPGAGSAATAPDHSGPAEEPSPETLEDRHDRQVSVAWLAGGGILALSGAGVAVGMLIAKNSAQSNADTVGTAIQAYSSANGIDPKNCAMPVPAAIAQSCGVWKNDNNTVNTDALIGNVALGVAIAASAATVVYWIVASHRSSASTARVDTVIVPTFGHGSGGLSLSAQF
jgi:tetratricopeptide (TPR) repeat protein